MWNQVSGSSVIRASNYITESHGFRSLMKLGFFVSLFLDNIVLYIYHILFLTITDIGHLPLVRTGKLDHSVGRLNVSTSAELRTAVLLANC